MRNRGRTIKLKLTISQAVALYYAAGSLRDDIICAADKTTNQPPVSGSRQMIGGRNLGLLVQNGRVLNDF